MVAEVISVSWPAPAGGPARRPNSAVRSRAEATAAWRLSRCIHPFLRVSMRLLRRPGHAGPPTRGGRICLPVTESGTSVGDGQEAGPDRQLVQKSAPIE